MEDDLDIEAELEAELAAQEELMADMEEDDGDNDTELSPKYVRLAKVSSLPDNFAYTYFEDKTK